jgi:hypothetical protein
MDLLPDADQLSHLMSQATAPAFVLGAVAAFVLVLLSRTTSTIDRIRSSNEVATRTPLGPISSLISRACGREPDS